MGALKPACVEERLWSFSPGKNKSSILSAEMPAKEIRSKLLPYVGKLVKVSGTIYSRVGAFSDAVLLDQFPRHGGEHIVVLIDILQSLSSELPFHSQRYQQLLSH